MRKPYKVSYTDIVWADSPVEALDEYVKAVVENPDLLRTYARAKIASESKN